MKKLLKCLFGTRNKQSVVSHTFIREGKEISNTKIVTTPRPNVSPAPQPRINCGAVRCSVSHKFWKKVEDEYIMQM